MSCDKITYETHGKAQQSMQSLAAKKGYSYSSYKCTFCGGIHIATHGKKKLRNEKRKFYYKAENYPPLKRKKTKPFEPERKILNPPDLYATSSTGKIMTPEFVILLKHKLGYDVKVIPAYKIISDS